MANRDKGRMVAALSFQPSLMENGSGGLGGDSVLGLATRCESLALLGIIERGGCSLPGRKGTNGLVLEVGGGSEEAVPRTSSMTKRSSWDGVVVAPSLGCPNWLGMDYSGWVGGWWPWLATNGAHGVGGERCWWIWGDCVVRGKLVMWGGVWDVGWKSGWRVGPDMCIVGGGGEGSGPPRPIG